MLHPPSTAFRSGLSSTHSTLLLFSSPSDFLHLSPCFIKTPATIIWHPTFSDSKNSQLLIKVLPELTASSMSTARLPLTRATWFGSRYSLLSPEGEVMDDVSVERCSWYQNLREYPRGTYLSVKALPCEGLLSQTYRETYCVLASAQPSKQHSNPRLVSQSPPQAHTPS